MLSYVDNIQLLRRSAEDAGRDARQWAAISGEADPAVADTFDPGLGEEEDGGQMVYRSGDIGSATRLIDVLRKMMVGKQITACSSEISEMVRQLYRFQQAALGSLDELRATAVPETAPRTGLPGQEQLRSMLGVADCILQAPETEHNSTPHKWRARRPPGGGIQCGCPQKARLSRTRISADGAISNSPARVSSH